MIGDVRDTALIAEMRTVIEDLTTALAGSRERTRQALDAATIMQGRIVQLEERVADLEATVELLRCGDLSAYMDGELDRTEGAVTTDRPRMPVLFRDEPVVPREFTVIGLQAVPRAPATRRRRLDVLAQLLEGPNLAVFDAGLLDPYTADFEEPTLVWASR